MMRRVSEIVEELHAAGFSEKDVRSALHELRRSGYIGFVAREWWIFSEPAIPLVDFSARTGKSGPGGGRANRPTRSTSVRE
jgi:hypothetical protein